MGYIRIKSTIGDNYVVEKEIGSRDDSEIIISPESYKTKSLFATVDYSPETSCDVSVGQRVLLKPDSGIDIDDRYCIVHHNEIVGIDDGEFPLKMIRDHVLVSAIKPTMASKHIYLPERGSEQTERTGINDCQIGVVVSVGRGYTTDSGVIPVDVRAGEYVAFHGDITSGISVVIDGEEYRILRERDIILSWSKEENE